MPKKKTRWSPNRDKEAQKRKVVKKATAPEPTPIPAQAPPTVPEPAEGSFSFS